MKITKESEFLIASPKNIEINKNNWHHRFKLGYIIYIFKLQKTVAILNENWREERKKERMKEREGREEQKRKQKNEKERKERREKECITILYKSFAQSWMKLSIDFSRLNLLS